MTTQHDTDQLASLLVKVDLSQRIKSFGAEFQSPSGRRQEEVLKLLEDNDRNFHIFFHDNGYHNHFVHHLLTAYVLGVSVDRMKKIYKVNAAYQRPKPASQIVLTEENWTEHLGKKDMWTDYLEFFENALHKDGIQKCIEKYAVDGPLFERVFEGVFHPLIHIGFGFEFQIPLIAAEGLALAAVNGDRFSKLISEEYLSVHRTEGADILNILRDIAKDETLSNFLSYSDSCEERYQKLTDGTVQLEAIKQHASKWHVGETEDELKKAARELYEKIALVYGATAIRPKCGVYRPDFYLLHGLTSMFMLYSMLPYMNLQQRRKLLKGQFVYFAVFYFHQGCPDVNTELLKKTTFKVAADAINPWLEVINVALKEDYDPHVIKTIRALYKANEEFGPRDDGLYLKIAQLTLEGYEYGYWDFNGVGWEEDWTAEGLQKSKENNPIKMFSKASAQADQS